MSHRIGREALFWSAGVFLLQVMLLWPAREAYLGLQDEGFVASVASRVCHGEMPYRDYFTRAMPGTDWLLGLSFRVLGEQLWVLRGYFALMAGLLAASVQWFSCRLLPRGWSELPAILFMSLGVQAFPLANCQWDASIFSLLALTVLAERRRVGALVLAGVLCGVTVLFIQTKGVATCAGAGLLVLLEPLPWRQRLRNLGGLVAGALVPGALFTAWLLSVQLLGAFLTMAIGVNLNAYVELQSVPYSLSPLWEELRVLAEGLTRIGSGGTLAWTLWFFRALAFAVVDWVKFGGYYPVLLAGAVLAFRRARSRPWTVQDSALVGLVLVLCLASALDAARPNRYRLNLQSPLWNPLLVYCLWRLTRFRSVLTGVVLAAYLAHGLDNLTGWWRYRYPIAFPRGVLRAEDPRLAALTGRLVADVLQSAPPGTPVFIFPDLMFAAWLLDRPNPTRLPEAIPLMYPEQEFVLAREALYRQPSACLVYFPLDPHLGGDYPRIEPARFAAEQERLHRFFTEGCRVSAETPAYRVYVR
ncbi:MAG: hypothetical protein AB1758_01365 [Candidatus Eremiobacterota bacterium]